MGRKLYKVVLTDSDRERSADEFERAWRQRCEARCGEVGGVAREEAADVLMGWVEVFETQTAM